MERIDASQGAAGLSHSPPLATLRDRLVQMAANKNLAVTAIDPAYTSKWGAEHWLSPLQKISPDMTGHHATTVVIGRRGLRHRARRRGGCDSTRAAHREERATDSAGAELIAVPFGPSGSGAAACVAEDLSWWAIIRWGSSGTRAFGVGSGRSVSTVTTLRNG
ncbi:MAG: hypothetical protein M0004_08195 [Actinomycetota bacterium]|nr:hypothetical protein [Actinomycetota bacterium]